MILFEMAWQNDAIARLAIFCCFLHHRPQWPSTWLTSLQCYPRRRIERCLIGFKVQHVVDLPVCNLKFILTSPSQNRGYSNCNFQLFLILVCNPKKSSMFGWKEFLCHLPGKSYSRLILVCHSSRFIFQMFQILL